MTWEGLQGVTAVKLVYIWLYLVLTSLPM